MATEVKKNMVNIDTLQSNGLANTHTISSKFSVMTFNILFTLICIKNWILHVVLELDGFYEIIFRNTYSGCSFLYQNEVMVVILFVTWKIVFLF